MKARDVMRGHLPRIKRVPLPMAGTIPALKLRGKTPEQKEAVLEAWRAEHPGQPDPPEPPEVGLLYLDPGGSAEILEKAREFAIERGLENPQPDDELYEYGKAIWTCLLGVIDPDSNPEAPEPFFDGGLEQIVRMRELGVEGVQVLAREHEAFTQEVSGQLANLTDEGYQRMLEEVTGPAGFPFWCSMRPGLQWSFAHTTASQLRACLNSRSGGGSNSEEIGKSERRSKQTSTKRSSQRTTSRRGSRGEA